MPVAEMQPPHQMPIWLWLKLMTQVVATFDRFGLPRDYRFMRVKGFSLTPNGRMAWVDYDILGDHEAAHSSLLHRSN
jgi:hypothetical protein